MTYVMSDIHGFYEKYLDFLQYIHFSSQDKLYIIGDILDRGPEGIKLMQDVMKRPNVVALKGNHEMMMYPVLEELSGQTPAGCQHIIFEEIAISNIGQAETLSDFCSLGARDQWKMLDYISSMPTYMEVSVNSRKFFLVHGGLPDFESIACIDYYDENELLFGPHDYSIKYFDDATVIVGHLPTRFISEAEPDKIFRSNGSINLDCGLGFGGQLGVLCLETDEEMYF